MARPQAPKIIVRDHLSLLLFREVFYSRNEKNKKSKMAIKVLREIIRVFDFINDDREERESVFCCIKSLFYI